MKRVNLPHLAVLCILLAITGIFYSCQKEAGNNQNASTEETKTLVKNWLNSKRIEGKTARNNRIAHILENLEMDKLFVEKKEETQLIIIPAKKELRSVFNKDKSAFPFLVINISKDNRLQQGYLILVSTDLNLGKFNKNIFSRLVYEKEPIDGRYTYLTVFDGYKNTFEYKNGKRISFSELQTSLDRRTASRSNCTEWYIETTHYNPDGSVAYVTETIIAVTCENDCPPVDPECVDSGDGSDPSGGGGSGSGTGDGCNYAPNIAQALIDAVSYNTSNSGTVTLGNESSPDINGIIEKNLLIAKHQFAWNWMAGYSTTYALIFDGVVNKTSNTAAWKWKTLTFNKVQQISGGTPPCFSENTIGSVSTSISSDKKTVSFTALVSTTLTIPCLFGYKQGVKTLQISDTYDADILAR